MSRSYCEQPAACVAGRRGPCRRCQPEKFEAARAGFQAFLTPRERARRAERRRRLNCDLDERERRAELRRDFERTLALAAARRPGPSQARRAGLDERAAA